MSAIELPVSDLYARKSTADAGKSVARQERAWRADCAREQITPGRAFVDPDFSASRHARRGRPDYAALLDHIGSRQCQMVSLWESSRGSRQMGEWVHFLDLCRDMGVLIRVFGDDDPITYDPRRQRDRDSLMKDGMAAEAESERIRTRTMAGIADAAGQGRPPGPLMDGYRRVYGAPTADSTSESGNRRRQQIDQVVDEERAEIYRTAAEGLLNGVPAHFIARVLNAWGVPTATGRGQWTGNQLWERLTLPTMQGHRTLNGMIVARDAWPAIIDSDTANRLLRAKRSPRTTRTHSDTRLKYTLSGVVLCDQCGRGMQGHARRTGPRLECEPQRGGCGRLSGRMDHIEAVVTEMVVSRLRQPDAMAIFQPVQDDSELRTAQAELDALRDRQTELYQEAAKPGGPSMALVAAAERELVPRIDAASRRLQALRTPAALRDYDPVDLADNWLAYSVGERRVVVVALAEIRLSPALTGGSWSPLRLAQSRWVGDSRTWGDLWRKAGSVGVAG